MKLYRDREAGHMPAGSRGREQFVADELVVAIPHQDLVLGELADLADPTELVTNVRISRSDQRLGLSAITVTHAPSRSGPDGDDAAALDRLLTRIRGACARRYDGWVSTIGKNRLLQPVIAPAGHPGVGSPVPCDRASSPPAPAGGRGRGVRVAVFDAHAFPHQDLVAQVADEGSETRLRQTDKLPSHAGHATFVAGLIAQRAPLADLQMHDVVDGLFGNVIVTADTSDSMSLRAFEGYATWSSTTFAAATVCGEIAAGTIPGDRDAREALNDLLRQLPSEAGVDIWAYDQRAGQ
jgi:hypothetical protein